MSIRTDEDAVKALLRPGTEEGDYDDTNTPDLTVHIQTASVIADQVALCAVAKGKTLTESQLELIERWLAAHFYVMSDQVLHKVSTLNSYGQFQGETKMQLDASKYGQSAKLVDTSGCLAEIDASAANKTKRVRGIWLGKLPAERNDFEDLT